MSATIRVWADSRSPGTCRGCKRPIEWAHVVASGARMPFDEITVLTTEKDYASGRWIATVDLTRNHWGTCTHRETFKKRGAR